jgi:bacteriorhodopsin
LNYILSASDPVGMSFWLISMAMVAATVFFLIERDRVSGKWKTSLTVAGLVTLIAAVHYFYMRDVWVSTGESPTVYRYIDWLLTVPLLIIEFYLILSAITKVPTGVFWRLLAGSLIMLTAGFAGEVNPDYLVSGFVVGMLGWLWIMYEIFMGEASKINAASGNAIAQKAYSAMRMLVTVGWAVYPLGYVFGYFMGATNPDTLNLIYNVADLWNKIAFGLVIWAAAVASSE